MRVYLDNELLLSLDPPARYFSSPHWYTGGYLAYPSGAEEETEGKYCHWEKPLLGEMRSNASRRSRRRSLSTSRGRPSGGSTMWGGTGKRG
jgi:hypothetical protein